MFIDVQMCYASKSRAPTKWSCSLAFPSSFCFPNSNYLQYNSVPFNMFSAKKYKYVTSPWSSYQANQFPETQTSPHEEIPKWEKYTLLCALPDMRNTTEYLYNLSLFEDISSRTTSKVLSTYASLVWLHYMQASSSFIPKRIVSCLETHFYNFQVYNACLTHLQSSNGLTPAANDSLGDKTCVLYKIISYRSKHNEMNSVRKSIKQ